jgi:fatty acid desaturase
MNYLTENDVKKLGPFIRVLAGFVLFCVILTIALLVFAAFTEPFHPFLLVGVPMLLVGAHVSGKVALTGYAPKYLLYAHGPKQNT